MSKLETLIEKGLNKFFKLEEISRYDGPYLKRWHIWTGSKGKVYLHRFYSPDRDDAPHDHPWDSYICILAGSYEEELYLGSAIQYTETRKPFRPRKMKAETSHKVAKLNRDTVWTLCICGEKRRDWGFWTDNGFIPWRDYLKSL